MFSYQYDEPYAEPECFECSEKENKITDVMYWLRAVLDQLYGLEEFDAESLERYLEELTHVVDMKIPKLELAVSTIRNSQIVPVVRDNVPVVRKNRTTDSNFSAVLNGWVEANNQYLKSLTYKNVGV